MSHTQNKSALLLQGIIIFIYLAILTGLEYFVAVSFQAVFILVTIAVVKAALVMYYYMHIYKLNEEGGDDQHTYEYKTVTNRIGLWLFLLSDSFVFGGLLVMRFNLLGLTRPHLNQFLGLIVTSVLLISSFFMNRAETAMKHGDRKAFITNIIVTFVLGAMFVIGVLFVEWPGAIEEGVVPSLNTYGAAFFMMTGMHAFHVLTGLIFLVIVAINGYKGHYDKKDYPIEAAAVYWHFVDLVWIFFYPALYLIGKLTG